MSITKSGYKFDGQDLGYEILDNGYMLYLDETKWVKQDAYIPFKKATMEESAIAHIEDIIATAKIEEEEKLDLEQMQDKFSGVLEDVEGLKVSGAEMLETLDLILTEVIPGLLEESEVE